MFAAFATGSGYGLGLARRALCTSTGAKVPVALVAQLRKRYVLPMQMCRDALAQNDNDVERAAEWLEKEQRKRGQDKLVKLSQRSTAEGWIGAQSTNGTSAVLIEVNSETDFVARNAGFRELVSHMSTGALRMCDAHAQTEGRVDLDTAALLKEKTDDGKVLGDLLADFVGKVGENTVVRRALGLKITDGIIGTYAHAPLDEKGIEGQGLKAGMVAIKGIHVTDDNKDYSRKVAQHIVGMGLTTAPRDAATGVTDVSALLSQNFIFDGSKTIEETLKGKGSDTVVQDYAVLEVGAE